MDLDEHSLFCYQMTDHERVFGPLFTGKLDLPFSTASLSVRIIGGLLSTHPGRKLYDTCKTSVLSTASRTRYSSTRMCKSAGGLRKNNSGK